MHKVFLSLITLLSLSVVCTAQNGVTKSRIKAVLNYETADSANLPSLLGGDSTVHFWNGIAGTDYKPFKDGYGWKVENPLNYLNPNHINFIIERYQSYFPLMVDSTVIYKFDNSVADSLIEKVKYTNIIKDSLVQEQYHTTYNPADSSLDTTEVKKYAYENKLVRAIENFTYDMASSTAEKTYIDSFDYNNGNLVRYSRWDVSNNYSIQLQFLDSLVYDNKNTLIRQASYDFDGSSLNLSDQLIFTNDTLGKFLSFEDFHSRGEWVYDTLGRLDTIYDKSYNGSSFDIRSVYHYIYDSTVTNPKASILYANNSTGLDTFGIYNFVFNVSNKIDTIIQYNFDTVTRETTPHMMATYSYNAGGQSVNNFLFEWNNSDSVWVANNNSYKFIYQDVFIPADTGDGETSIQPIVERMDVNIYPNPTNGYLVIELDAAVANVEINVYDMLGRLLQSNRYETLTKTQVDVTNLMSGNYLIQIKSDKKSNIVKFVKQ